MYEITPKTHAVLLFALGWAAVYLHFELMFTEGYENLRPILAITLMMPFLFTLGILIDIRLFTPVMRRLVVVTQFMVSVVSDAMTTGYSQCDYADLALLYGVFVFRGPRDTLQMILAHLVIVVVFGLLGLLSLPSGFHLLNLVCVRFLFVVCSLRVF